MDKEQADIEARKILSGANEKAKQIIEAAKERGDWEIGLDSNKKLFEELDIETRTKLRNLKLNIDNK